MTSKQLKYWYRKYLRKKINKYTPEKIKNFLFLITQISHLLEINALSKELKNDTPMSQLTWASSYNLVSDNKLISKSVEYIKNANLLNFEHDKKLNTDSQIMYQFEYDNMNNFPGEHYRLLISIINTENFEQVIEVGTGSGIASKLILSETRAKINTFDIVPWVESNSHLTPAEVTDPRLRIHIENLEQKKVFEKNIELFCNSNLIFLDASKDGVFEDNLLVKLSNLKFEDKFKLLFIDDIRYSKMYKIWSSIKSPKIDLTSFGHWSGTGVVDITNGLIYKSRNKN
ncbi:hypothetical protein N9R77_00715 [Candidatus Actinomarina sp.]|jgi:hypothetical protein|nr:hypothetical protein [Candidatus Actinomarina sp.]